MNSVSRRPLTARNPTQPLWADKPTPTHVRSHHLAVASTHKRPRSPDADEINPTATAKRIKPASSQTLSLGTITSTKTAVTTPNAINIKTGRETKDRQERLRQKEERQQAREEFLAKYTKAFPSFVFYFDDRDGGRQQAESKVLALGAVRCPSAFYKSVWLIDPKKIEHFFSASVTHVITNRPQPPKNEQYDPSNKENVANKALLPKGNVLKSPIQLKARNHDHGGYDKLVRNAVQLDKKIWSFAKLDNVLARLIPSSSNASKVKVNHQSPPLTKLLQHERLHGTTSERDPRERRHDYQYFAKGSHFLLVEDMWGELAPISIMEYPAPPRSVEKDKLPTYPVLYMDPRARSPFVRFDEKQARKLEKMETNEKLKEAEKEKHRTKMKEILLKRQNDEAQRKTKNLRRCVSMSQLGRRAVTRADIKHLGSDNHESGVALSNSLGIAGDNVGQQQVASGFGPSTTGLGTGHNYLAASGNSVAITSTTTTSLARTLGSGSSRLPPNLREQLGRQVVTSRRLDAAGGKENINPFESRLRKAKSTTTMRLPAREESKKPGYCEACRVKFEDFTEHIRGPRHRKFAQNENNYIDLDFLLRRLQRKLSSDVESEVESPDMKTQEDPPSDACLGPGDYFYLSPEQNLQAELKVEDGWEETSVPRIVIDEDNS
ncbi:hypothetical protein K439DRAFT_1621857 [Ramaria rubella]|nr:hypothetical protein K439DRAFT_1621857 [Ramaria rubella]